MIISGMAKSSLLDYPGLISCVLFVPGCNFDCFYCHNRELIDGTAETLKTDDVMEFLKKRRELLDGVVITGGEPTLQSGLQDFIREIKDLGYKVKLDTNGSNPGIVKELLSGRLCDYYAVDYKAPAAMYEEICGAPADGVLETINLLLGYGADFQVRTTVIPQLGKKELLTMAHELPLLPRYVLNRYRKPEKYLPRDKEKVERTPYTEEHIAELADAIRGIQPNVAV